LVVERSEIKSLKVNKEVYEQTGGNLFFQSDPVLLENKKKGEIERTLIELEKLKKELQQK